MPPGIGPALLTNQHDAAGAELDHLPHRPAPTLLQFDGRRPSDSVVAAAAQVDRKPAALEGPAVVVPPEIEFAAVEERVQDHALARPQQRPLGTRFKPRLVEDRPPLPGPAPITREARAACVHSPDRPVTGAHERPLVRKGQRGDLLLQQHLGAGGVRGKDAGGDERREATERSQ